MRRLLLSLLSGGLLAVALATPAAAATPRIVGGSSATIAAHPYQVALVATGASPRDGFFCGGVVLDALHVATAAHCVLDDTTGQATPPSGVAVVAGTPTLSSSVDLAHTHAVAVTSFDPAYDADSEVGDVGILTLTTPLWSGSAPALDGTSAVAPIGLATSLPAAGATVTVSGWGYDEALDADDDPATSGYPAGLRAAALSVVSHATCAQEWAGMTITAGMLCTSSDTHGATCFGDSGGPVVTGAGAAGAPAGETLAGVVNFGGEGCAQGSPPDVSAAVADPALASFLTTSHPQAPEQTKGTTLGGSARSGQTVTCGAGDWSDSPAYTYRWGRVVGDGAQAITSFSSSPTLQLGGNLVGAQILCEVRAANAGGYGYGDSSAVTVEAASGSGSGGSGGGTTGPGGGTTGSGGSGGGTTGPGGGTTGSGGGTTGSGGATGSGSSGATPSVGSAKDTRRPASKVVTAHCTRHRCVVNVVVTDPRPSAGIRRLRAVLGRTVVARCGPRHHRHRCTVRRHRWLSARSIGGGHFLVTAAGLGHRAYTLALRAVDKAGHVQRTLTRARLRPPRR